MAKISLGSVALTASAGVLAAQPAGADAVATSASPVALASTSTYQTTSAKPSANKKLSKAARQRLRAQKAVKIAKKQIGDPYRWGATGPGAFDCSGLAVYAWRKAGVKIPRTTWAQLRGVKKKVGWKSLKPGDLVFTSGGGHVGIYVGQRKMVHSPRSGTRVRIDKLNSYRKRTFVGAVRPGF
jgi:cell wall-associated NlpC family hydrolase